jgi:hypothetical protein
MSLVKNTNDGGMGNHSGTTKCRKQIRSRVGNEEMNLR